MTKHTKPESILPLVSIVILNWNGAQDTVNCLNSIKSLEYSNYEVVVVDNGSTESIEPILSYNQVPYKLIRNTKNLGFTGGEIVGLRECSGEYILILNNDAILDKHVISEALSAFATDDKIAAVGGRTYLLDEKGRKKGLFHYTHQSVDPITAEVNTYTKDDGVICDITTVSGACVLIRRKAIEECGYFDNRFFAYYEETDLFSRYRRAGWRIVYSPSVVIWHKMGASTRNKKYMYYYLMLKNQYLFAYKNFNKEYLHLFQVNHRRHFLRALSIYVKRLGKLSKDEVVYKARITAYITGVLRKPSYRLARRETQLINKDFDLNEKLFTDNPLPISVLIDATEATSRQIKTLSENLRQLTSSAIRPNEIIITSKKSLDIPKTSSLIRIENVVDKGIFEYTPYDMHFMTSNNDMLLFCSDDILNKKSSDAELSISETIKHHYITWTSHEAHAIIESPSDRRISLGYFTKKNYRIVAIKKSNLVNHLDEHPDIIDITNNTLTDVIGRSLAHGMSVRGVPLPKSSIFGVKKGDVNYHYEPILQRPFLWWVKNTLTRVHIWGITAKIIRKLIKSIGNKPIPTETTHSTYPVQPIEYSSDFPVIINTRDRYDPLVKQIKWLEKTGHKRIVFIDNDSAYPPLLDLFRTTPYQVIRLGRNGMHKAPWESMGVRFSAKNSPYILTDPDVIPSDDCPLDVFSYFTQLLNKYPYIKKVGFGLKIDDIPDHFTQKSDVLSWESRYWSSSLLLEPNVFKADIDTTLALYRPNTQWFLDKSIRTGGNYTVHHEPWYQNTKDPSEDFMFYRMRASREVSTWGLDDLPKHHMRALKKEGYIDEIIDKEDE